MSASTQTANDLMVVFSNTISAGFDALSGAVNGVFGLMIALVVALTGIQWALSSNREVLASGFGKVLLIGAFAYLINDWQGLSQTLWDGFIDIGLTAGGGRLLRADFLNPGAILQQGWEIVKALGETPAPMGNIVDVMGSLTDALILGLAMIGIMLAFAVLALQIIVTLLEFKIVTLGGFVLLPFGIWSKSSFLAERPLGFVVSSGLKVLALAIVVSGARSVFDQLQPSGNPDLYEALAILSASLLLAMLALFIPNLASALVTGGPALGAGAALAGGLAVGGAAMAGVGAVSGAGAAAGGAAARFAGPARAASGAATGRGPGAPGGGFAGGLGPRPSNDNPPGGPASGSAPGSGAPSGSGGHGPGLAQPVSPGGSSAAAPSEGADSPSPAPVDPRDTNAGTSAETTRGTEKARRDFQAALQAGGKARPQRRPGAGGRNAALQSFFAANAGRSLLPGNETSGALTPPLKDEET